jgi:N-acetylglutamate synthase-like GNAT family acetyltransferase
MAETGVRLDVRKARPEDIAAMTALIHESVRGLSRGFYSEQQVESAIRYVFGVDTALVEDGTYYCVEAGDTIAGCGGWSRRQTHYGGDHAKHEADTLIDPATDPARIRAFFVHPHWARRGIGRMLLDVCAEAARTAGFSRLMLVSTLPGEPLYRACGFAPIEPVNVNLPDGVVVPCVRMGRDI